MFLRPFVVGIVLLLAVSLNAQQSASTASPPPDAAAQAEHPTQLKSAQQDVVDAKIQQALRERDAIIRNLLERVQELETRLNAGNSGLTGHGPVPAAVAAAPAPISSLAASVNNAADHETEGDAP